nr:MFS transporter [Neorhizobium sp. T6_25]
MLSDQSGTFRCSESQYPFQRCRGDESAGLHRFCTPVDRQHGVWPCDLGLALRFRLRFDRWPTYATELGIALAARTTGFLLAVPIAGVLADRSGPRPVILTSGLVAAAAMLVILAAFAGPEALSSWLLLTGAFAVGIGQGAFRPAYRAIIPKLASDELLQPANAAMSISVRVTSIVGPAIFSLVAQSAGTMAALAAIALLWLTSALVPPRIAIADNKERHQRRLALTAIVFEFADGAREARRHPRFVAGLSALTVTIATGYSVTSVLLPGISQEVYRGAVPMTATATAYMAGALVGALLLTRWHPVERGWMAFAGLSIYGLAPISLLFPQDVIVPIAAYFVAGIGIFESGPHQRYGEAQRRVYRSNPQSVLRGLSDDTRQHAHQRPDGRAV